MSQPHLQIVRMSATRINESGRCYDLAGAPIWQHDSISWVYRFRSAYSTIRWYRLKKQNRCRRQHEFSFRRMLWHISNFDNRLIRGRTSVMRCTIAILTNPGRMRHCSLQWFRDFVGNSDCFTDSVQ